MENLVSVLMSQCSSPYRCATVTFPVFSAHQHDENGKVGNPWLNSEDCGLWCMFADVPIQIVQMQ